MAGWRKTLASIAINAEEQFDVLKERLRKRLGNDPLHIVVYQGFAISEQFFLRGRVVENSGVRAARDNDTIWDNLANMYRRFESDEIPDARVAVCFQDTIQEAVTDQEGFFDVVFTLPHPVDENLTYFEVDVTLLEPLPSDGVPVSATGRVYMLSPQAQFGVISDIDDTIVRTDATNLLRMARTVFLGNARTRLPFSGVTAFYQALQKGSGNMSINPFFYVSSSPWNLYDMLVDFFDLQDLPKGLLLLRDWGLSREDQLPTKHLEYKLSRVCEILEDFPGLPFLLIGDSGQEDPEIYREAVQRYPGRIRAIYIRDVLERASRRADIERIAHETGAAGVPMLLVKDTLEAAHHAVSQGWIDPACLMEIAENKESDEAPPGTVERILSN
ncbi:MAG: DUF2183 domain-containing protein [Chloroflexi bacterium AL-W]|nr:DUF2183 domain-containing protein [Chloroflexi bacterium AL-N1]NOK69927.1 DUF2183 domain-containing protein [Chloroflexi bacterium AL-N10]NOK73777.1 DUF2183 domain-containing protein [Chloroflexi bacterium AL-N5]NOK85459.1 DUF2183 domain-containing protein [Chloroflexi bacterium AL-W]NOK91660.1 DUF2183 domain-containing protein [Chloroflexi bacterium AL-N15]